MNTYKLLTPGPLTTTDTVKLEMLVDRCTWDDDYKAVTQKIRRQLLQLGHVSEDDYTAVLMQGSGTFGVESVLSSVVGDEDKVLICSNGAYGVRMTRICDRNRIPYVHYAESYDHIPDPARVARLLAQDPAITHVAMVHSETTSGILNDIQSVGKVVRDAGRTFIVDAMSSFGGVDIPVSDWGIDFLVSSANKCIQGVPGFSFILCRRDKLLSSEGKARSLSLDLLDQWKGMEKDGKWRFTSPTHVVLAFSKAFHGRTSGAVAATDNPAISAPFNRTANVEFVPLNDIGAARAKLATGEFAAVIIEGIQGVAGIHCPADDFLRELRTAASETGTQLILDEIQSGYGRTGRFFAHQAAGIRPDLITTAKGMGNGFPIGGVLIAPHFEARPGLLGTTFGGNHLACAAAIAVLDAVMERKKELGYGY